MRKIRNIDIAALTVEEALEIFNNGKDDNQHYYGFSDPDINSISARSTTTERHMLAGQGGELHQAKVIVSVFFWADR